MVVIESSAGAESLEPAMPFDVIQLLPTQLTSQRIDNQRIDNQRIGNQRIDNVKIMPAYPSGRRTQRSVVEYGTRQN